MILKVFDIKTKTWYWIDVDKVIMFTYKKQRFTKHFHFTFYFNHHIIKVLVDKDTDGDVILDAFRGAKL